ncbi:glycosyltransferase [uncultured Campylobacter sp.]|uniref:glycosyltransferase n=1 Tax=uncultured Campylobacter sp. TaxID=218934 RepID=UPI0025E3F847|nr:glycosyltransferase [uncultured Campylobacter sp.]
MDKFYKSFEDKFRGQRSEIKKRLLAYEPFLQILKQNYENPAAADLGCGRGEWLEILKQNGFTARGCDVSEEMIKECEKNALEAKNQGAIEFLSELEDSSLALVSAFQLVEHLEFNELCELIKQARRVLKDGGILILETPNPENLRVATLTFYLDVTHVKPIPPMLLEYLCEFEGFSNTFMMRLNSNLSFSEDLQNQNVTLRDVLSSVGLDYAILGLKNGDEKTREAFLNAAKSGYSFEELADRFDVSAFENKTQMLELKNDVWKESLETKEALWKSSLELMESKNQIVNLQNENARLHEDLENLLGKYLALNHKVYVLENEAPVIKNDIEQLKIFVAKFKRVAKPLIWVYKFLRFCKNLAKENLKKALKFGINLTERAANSHPKFKKNLKIFLNKFPAIRARIFSLKGQVRDDIYVSQEGVFEPSVFALRHSREYERNLELKNLKFNENFSEITVIGSISGHYSLAAINRNIVFRLLGKVKNVFVICYHENYFDKIEDIAITKDEYETLRSIVPDKNVHPKRSDDKVAIYHHYPLIEDVREGYGFEIAVFFWEESRIPQRTIEILNSKYKGILVSTFFIKKILIDNGCYTPVKVADIPLKMPPEPSVLQENSEQKREIKLFHISSCLPRKGADVLLRAFNEACKKAKFELSLTIKSFPNPHNSVTEQIELLVDKKYRSKIRVILNEDLTALDVANLYEQCDIVVLPTRGEGLNMPAIEGVHYKKPVISTDYSGQCEFLDDSCEFIGYKFAPAVTHFNLNYSFWAEPSVKDLGEKIIKVSEQILQNRAPDIKPLKHKVDEMMFGEKNALNFISSISHLKSFKNEPSELKIAYFSTYNAVCGIAEYSKYLTDELTQAGANLEIYTWSEQKRTKESNLSKENDEIKVFEIEREKLLSGLETDANIIWLQHHFTFFEIDEKLKSDVAALKSQGKICFITLHATKQILNYPRQTQQNWHDTLYEFDRVFVHSIDDLNTLRLLGLADNVTLVPHGTQNLAPEQNKRKETDGKFKVGFFGLLFAHKNLPVLLQAFAKFSQNTDAKLIIISPVANADSEMELQRCRKLCEKLNLDEKVEWNTEFLPIEEVNKKLSDCDVIVLPYGQTDEGASGAARIALSVCKNVIVTPSRIFSEMKNVTIKTDGFNDWHILEQLEKVKNSEIDAKIYDERAKWLSENSWSSIAGLYLRIFRAVATDKNFMRHLKNGE